MNKEVISDRQGICIIILFIIGSTSVFFSGGAAKKDVWIAWILALLTVLPLIWMFSKLHFDFQDKDLYDLIEMCFGKIIGKIVIMIFIAYAFYWITDVLVTYGLFVETVGLRETPQMIINIVFISLCGWIIIEGIELIGRCSLVFVLLAVTALLLVVILLIPDMEPNNLRPIMQEGFKPVFEGAFGLFSIPFSQMVILTMAFKNFKTKKSPYRIYIIGLLIGASLLLLIVLSNVLVLGEGSIDRTFYPTYKTVSRVSIGSSFQRIESSIVITFFLGGFIKISIILLGVCKGVSKLFEIKDYRQIVVPIVLLIINVSHFIYGDINDYFIFNRDIWNYFFFPFHVILPVIIFITAKIKRKMQNNTKLSIK